MVDGGIIWRCCVGVTERMAFGLAPPLVWLLPVVVGVRVCARTCMCGIECD